MYEKGIDPLGFVIIMMVILISIILGILYLL